MKNQNIINQSAANQQLAITPAEFGFVRTEQGPAFTPNEADLPGAFQGRVTGPIPTMFLETDQGNAVLLGSLVKFNSKIRGIADNIEPRDTGEYSERVQGFLLKGVKSLIDENGRGVSSIVAKELGDTIYYMGNRGTGNGNLLRVYFSQIGVFRKSGVEIPVIAKIGASRTKEAEAKLHNAFGVKGRNKV